MQDSPPNQSLISLSQERDFSILVNCHQPLIALEGQDPLRARALLAGTSETTGLPLLSYNAREGLVRCSTLGTAPVPNTKSLTEALIHISKARLEALIYFQDAFPFPDEKVFYSLLRKIHDDYSTHAGSLIFYDAHAEVPERSRELFVRFALDSPTPDQYHYFINEVLREVGKRIDISIEMNGDDVRELLLALHGLPLRSVRRLITRAVVEDGVLNRADLKNVLDEKADIISSGGLLEYFSPSSNLSDVAGLDVLKDWLRKRNLAFSRAEELKKYQLSAPRGLLLIGVQGCGKSLCAKSIAAEWNLPLVRFEPANIFQKYIGQSESNFHRALKQAEALAPIVLWIDEVEKVFSMGDNDGGTGKRILGAFLNWLQEKDQTVFVVATANDVSQLPPELLRKGRFDEIFFVDLPANDARQEIFRVHLSKRNQAPDDFDLRALSTASAGFSGAEIEQAIVSALYEAFGSNAPLTTELVRREIKKTRPLSVTMREKVESLRRWAKERAVHASSQET